MSDFKMKQEIKNLMKMGISEDMATLVVATKYGNLDLASEIVGGIADENEALKEALQDFRPFEPMDTTGCVITKKEDEHTIELLDASDNIILSSNSIEERNVKNENENL
jgi:hypothetical protein